MTDDELRAAIDAMMACPPCPRRGAVVTLVIPRGGDSALLWAQHADGCDAA